MNKHRRVTFLRQSFLYVLSLTCLCFVAVFAGLANVPSTHAAGPVPDPFVVVAVDATPSICTITRTVTNHLKTSIVHTHCPAGTAVSTTATPLARAKALHENYVMYPASPQQIQELIRTKIAVVQSTQNSSVHPTICDGGGYEADSITTNWRGDIISMSAYFDGASDCSNLFLDQEEVQGFSSVVTADYWNSVYYSSYNGYCASARQNGTDFISNNDLNVYPDATYAPNLWNRWNIATGSCSGSPGAITTYQVQLVI